MLVLMKNLCEMQLFIHKFLKGTTIYNVTGTTPQFSRKLFTRNVTTVFFYNSDQISCIVLKIGSFAEKHFFNVIESIAQKCCCLHQAMD